MKTYTPKNLNGSDLRRLMSELQASPLDIAKFLQVTERTVFRWLADASAPYSVLCALWHETPRGREACALDVGNALAIERGLARARHAALARESAKLARLLDICDTGAANDPFLSGPVGQQGHVGPIEFSRYARAYLARGINHVQGDLHAL